MPMTPWQEEFLNLVSAADSEAAVFSGTQQASVRLGFDYCAYGIKSPVPFSNPRITLRNNYPPGWQARYQEAGYLLRDPTVMHGRRSETPIIWSDAVFEDSPDLWREAQDFGLRHGWAQSCLNANGVGGMLTLSR